MEPTGVIEELWKRVEARDWTGLGELLAEDVVVEWPVTGERIVGRANFVAVNSAYPEGWSIRVLRIVGDGPAGDQAVSEVEVPHAELGVFRAASFFTVREGRVTAAREYWTDVGAEQPPEWRLPYTEAL